MLLRVLPKAPVDSSILFAINFPGLPPTLAEPTSWILQMDAVVADDLDVPSSPYAFDKAVALPAALVEQVTFDLPALTVNCRFIDGVMEEWPISLGCLKGLQIILEYLSSSAALTKKALTNAQENESGKAKHVKQLSLPSLSSSLSRLTGRHRKQRSLMSWMSSFIQPVFALNTSLLRSRPARTQVPPLSELLLEQSQEPPMSARAYRAKARSKLLDLFRQHVIPELTNRIPRGGYYCWIVHSMLTATATRLAVLMEGVGDQALSLPPFYHQTETDFPIDEGPPSPTTSQGAPAEGSVETDSDGSSVHTPSSAQHDQGVYFVEYPDDAETEPSSAPCSDMNSAKNLAQYTAYAAMALRLRDLLERADFRHHQMELEIQHRLAILEVRSRRRAWLNKQLVGGAALERNLGLSTPFASSPLRHSVYTWEDVQLQEIYEGEEDEEPFPLLVETALFPVCEEDDDEDEILIDEFPGVPTHIRPRHRVGCTFGAHVAAPPLALSTEADTSSPPPYTESVSS